LIKEGLLERRQQISDIKMQVDGLLREMVVAEEAEKDGGEDALATKAPGK
jgi:hypothetical protein